MNTDYEAASCLAPFAALGLVGGASFSTGTAFRTSGDLSDIQMVTDTHGGFGGGLVGSA